MIALPPVVAVEQCVAPTSPEARQLKVIVDLRGDPAKVAPLLRSPDRPAWSVTSDTMERRQRHVVLTLDQAAIYKQIGGFIYSAQAQGLTVATRTNPPICGTDKK